MILAGLFVLAPGHRLAWSAEYEDSDGLVLDTSPGEPRLSLHGYADLQYGGDSSDLGGAFVQNELSVFLRATTEDERWTAFTEVEFDHIGGEVFLSDRGGNETEVEMEAGWIEFRHKDRFRLRGGKLLLPQYWQSNHYPNLTMSALAPLMSGNIFPKSVVAIQASGDWWNENERGVGYSLFLGAGAKTALQELAQDDRFVAGARLSFRMAGREKPDWIDTLDVSFSALVGENDVHDSELILGVDTQIRLGRLELLAEFAHGKIPRLDDGGLPELFPENGDTTGLYVQAAYRLSPKWHVFYRFDFVDFNSGYTTPRDEARHTAGVNFRPRANVSLKLEVFHSEPEGPRDFYDGFASSIVFNF